MAWWSRPQQPEAPLPAPESTLDQICLLARVHRCRPADDCADTAGHESARYALLQTLEMAERMVRGGDETASLAAFGELDLLLTYLTPHDAPTAAHVGTVVLRLAGEHRERFGSTHSSICYATDKAAHAMFRADRPIDEQVKACQDRVDLWRATSDHPTGIVPAQYDLDEVLAWSCGGKKPFRVGW